MKQLLDSIITASRFSTKSQRRLLSSVPSPSCQTRRLSRSIRLHTSTNSDSVRTTMDPLPWLKSSLPRSSPPTLHPTLLLLSPKSTVVLGKSFRIGPSTTSPKIQERLPLRFVFLMRTLELQMLSWREMSLMALGGLRPTLVIRYFSPRIMFPPSLRICPATSSMERIWSWIQRQVEVFKCITTTVLVPIPKQLQEQSL